ncbi:hypothetical protein BDP55DRAFT_636637 [Colletotrichum godetiae]|uniref:Uncharacterized protein n=1 Tax=Colletotrichum godetiae TaxID=1209918 RepID=A0AAJ0ESR1_9PEZI|nr:uncharacterized protein BDP55DRAFT_636637 [Colletotrichum godetiae]KAK1659809.1 hypothetical protein BDP55DRAFT_636637 [Colletotrichum godetiae]
MASRTSSGKRAWYQGVPQPGMGQQHKAQHHHPQPQQPRQQNEQRHPHIPPQQQQQYQQQQQQKHDDRKQQMEFLQFHKCLMDDQTNQIIGKWVHLLQNAINDPNVIRQLQACMAGPKSQRSLREKQGSPAETKLVLDRLERQSKAMTQMTAKLAGQVELLLETVKNMETRVASLEGNTTRGMEILKDISISCAGAATVGGAKTRQTKPQVSSVPPRRSGRVTKQRKTGNN